MSRRVQVVVPVTGTICVDITVDDCADACDIQAAAVRSANDYLGDVYGPDARFCGEAQPTGHVAYDEATDRELAWR